jgi:ribonuclease Z
MDFEVTILGSNAAIPTLSRGTTSQFVQCKQRHILIDCGEGTQLQLRKFQIKYQRISTILISHLHGDHVFGLPGLISTMQLMGRTQGVTIYGPVGIKKLLKTQLEAGGGHFQFTIDFIELETNASGLIFEDKCIEIYHFPLKHRIATHGYRIQEKPALRKLIKAKFDATGVSVAYIQKLLQGEDITDNRGITVKSDDVTLPPAPTRSYAFCSDTAYSEAILPHIEDVDLLYHESTFLDSEASRAADTFHSTAKQAATIAQKSGAKKLILGHFSSRYKDLKVFQQEAEEIFQPVAIPSDGDVFVID